MLRVNQLIGFGVGGGVVEIQPLFNPSDLDPSGSLSDGNRTADFSAQGGVRSTTAIDGVNRYIECLPLNGAGNSNWRFGIATSAHTITSSPGGTSTSWCVTGNTADKITNGSATSYGSGIAGDTGMTLMMAVSAAGSVWWGANGTWFASGDPAADSNAAFTGLTGPFYILFGANSGSPRIVTLKLLADYLYSPPAGFTRGW